MSIKHTDKYYKTTDLCLASTLVSKRFKLLDAELVVGDKQAIFIFEASSSLENTIDSYWSKQLTVIPQDFFSTQKFLKSMIYERQNHVT